MANDETRGTSRAEDAHAKSNGPRPLTGKAIEELRRRLLDTGLKNPLIKFPLSETSKRNIRLVDEVPSVLIERLKIGSQLIFAPVPLPEIEPEDERTPEFREAVRSAKKSDPEYLTEVTELGPRARQKKLAAIERRLRDRLREARGMKPWRPTRSAKEHAQTLGINTDYDLPQEAAEGQRRHTDDKLQTLFFPDDLEAKLSGIYTAASSLEKDAGIPALYVAFGFLEWYPSLDSSEQNYAPLLLWPVEMTKELEKHNYVFAIAGRDEDESINHSLLEKLKGEFGLTLPALEDYEDEERGTIELGNWFEAIQETIKQRDPRWRVRNWAVVGIMTFHKITLWRDLDSANWPVGADPRDNRVLNEIFDGAEPWDGRPAPEHDIDAIERKDDAPLLITEADSSQHSAVIDVIAGKNLVIQGPPGTGKSQTIANIIGAALHSGKNVLFMAEKMAALEVVKSRLDALGLGDFCLELHSDKTSRPAVLGSLKKRVEMARPRGADGELEGVRRQIEKKKAALTAYVDKMNTPVRMTGRTVHDVLWGHARTRDFLEASSDGSRPAGLKKVRIAKPLEMEPLDLQELKELARALDEAAAALGGEAQPSRQPWRGIGRTDITTFDADTVAAAAGEAAQTVRRAIGAIGELATMAGWSERPNTLGAFSKVIMGAPTRSDTLPDPRIVAALNSLIHPGAKAEVERLIEAVERRRLSIKELAQWADPERMLAAGEDTIADARTAVGRLDLGSMTPADLKASLRTVEEAGQKVDAALIALRKLGPLLRTDAVATADGLSALLVALEAGFPAPEVREVAIPKLLAENALAQIEKAKELAEAVAIAFACIGEGAAADGIAGPTALRQAAAVLRQTGFFGRLFSSDFKRAVEIWRRMLPGQKRASREEMARAIDAAAGWRSSLEDFETFVQSSAVLKETVAGIKAPFDRLIQAARWMAALRRATPAVLDGALEIRAAIIEADADRIQVLDGFAAKHGPVLRSLTSVDAKTSPDEAARRLHERRNEMQALVEAIGRLGWREDQALGNLGAAARFADEIVTQGRKIEAAGSVSRDLSTLWTGFDTDTAFLREAVKAADQLSGWPLSREVLQRLLESDDPLAGASALIEHFEEAREAVRAARAAIDGFRDQVTLSLKNWAGSDDLDHASLEAFAAHAERAAAWPLLVPRQCAIQALETKAREAGLGSIIDAWINADMAFSGLELTIDAVWLASAAEAVLKADPTLSNEMGSSRESLRRQFRRLDEQWLELNRKELASKLARRPVPRGSNSGPKRTWTDLALVSYQYGLDRPSMHLRRLFAQAGNAIRSLKPCLMMSPMSVARYLAAGMHTFDLLVVDEASQMRPEDAASAILRANQVVVVGDPQQLPPSNFFEAQGAGQAIDEEAQEVDEESILELAMRTWKPVRVLRWHYRSRHESLIHYSNLRFYDGNLIVFPSNRDRGPDFGVHLEKVPGVYANSRNTIEARAIVEAAREFMRTHREKSLGIVAMNQPQQELIGLMMDELYAEDPEAESYRRRWSAELERLFVKNLENVQGDERDAIFISTVYGPDDNGVFRKGFGPINQTNGHRRLNVLFTRAKEITRVFTSMDPAQIVLGPDTKFGVRVLKEYLDYARTGYVPETPVEDADRGPESEFERWFLERLRERGYDAVPQVGVKGYRIDIGIRHPDWPGRYILGVECDGASYHSAKTARDRDRLRQIVLERLGWTIYRIWSTDWFLNPEAELANLVHEIEWRRGSAMK